MMGYQPAPRIPKRATYNIELLYRRLEPATDRKNDHTKQFEAVEVVIHYDSTWSSRVDRDPDGELP
jgi:hypothetical protein